MMTVSVSKVTTLMLVEWLYARACKFIFGTHLLGIKVHGATLTPYFTQL